MVEMIHICHLFNILQQDQVATAAVYEEFVASFSDASKQGKTWVKGETVNAEKGNNFILVLYIYSRVVLRYQWQNPAHPSAYVGFSCQITVALCSQNLKSS